LTCLLVSLFACGSERAPEPPPAAAVPQDQGATPADDAPLGDLLGGQEGTATAPMGLGMRGEGPQNGGPKYPSIADVAPHGYGTWANTPARDDAPPNLGHNVWVDRAEVSAGLDADAITRAIRAQRGHLLHCYMRAVSDRGETSGEASLVIGADGRCMAAHVSADALPGSARACMERELHDTLFPAVAGTATVPLRMSVTE
jgi:hypothetical protein